MAERAGSHGEVAVAVVGAGFIGRGVVAQLLQAPGMRPAVLVNRTIDRALDVWRVAGVDPASVVVDDDPARIAAAVAEGRPTVTSDAAVLPEITGVDVVVEATGAMDHGARVILDALVAGRDVVSMNAEVDATIGTLLRAEADRTGAVYTLGDGDQPGVLLRHLEFVAGMGFEVVAALNCKRNLDIHQNPTDSRPYAERDGTSELMTTAFGDGTKMQIENACVANLSGLVPDRRGMHGVRTTVEHAVTDVLPVLARRGVVEYTLGGDFGGGVAVIAHGEGELIQPYMRYSKMGEGPDYLFFRPYHLLHFEVPWTIADVILDRQMLGEPRSTPVAEVVAVAKKPLVAGERLDGIGGYCVYGHIDTVAGATGFLPVGLAEHATANRSLPADEPVPLDAVDLDGDALLVQLRRRQETLVASTGPST